MTTANTYTLSMLVTQNICRYLVDSASSEHQIVKHMFEVGCLATPTTSQQNNGMVPPGCEHTMVCRLRQRVYMWRHVFWLTSSEHVHHLVRNTCAFISFLEQNTTKFAKYRYETGSSIQFRAWLVSVCFTSKQVRMVHSTEGLTCGLETRVQFLARAGAFNCI
jgi:hypothetical protein